MMHLTKSVYNTSWATMPEYSQLDNKSSMESTLALYMAVALMTVIIVVGGVGNLMVILAVRTTKKLQTVSNAFVVNLSVCDLVFVMVILPFNIYTYLTDGWNLPTFLCKLIGFLGYTLTGTTIITITLIAWNRYKLVVEPHNYHSLFAKKRMALMLAVAWVLPMTCLLPAVLEMWGRFGYVTMMVTCNLLLDHDSQSFKLFLLIVRAVIPCFLILFYYISIYRTTKASHRRVRRDRNFLRQMSHLDQMIQRKEMRLTKMMAIIFIVFALSYFPCTISSMVDWNTVLSKRFHMFCLITVYVGSAMNPLIYGLMNSQFRCAYYSILLCQCCYTACDDKAANSPSPPTPKIYKKVNRKKSSRKGRAKLTKIKTAGQDYSISSPTPLLKKLTERQTPDLTNSSVEQSPPVTRTGVGRVELQNCQTLSQDSNPASWDIEGGLHRTETQKTCLENCEPEHCRCKDSSII